MVRVAVGGAGVAVEVAVAGMAVAVAVKVGGARVDVAVAVGGATVAVGAMAVAVLVGSMMEPANGLCDENSGPALPLPP